MRQHTTPQTPTPQTPTAPASLTEINRAEAAAFFDRMQRLPRATMNRITREGRTDHKLLAAMREMAEWCKPVQVARTEREARQAAEREVEAQHQAVRAAHFAANRRKYVHASTVAMMPAPKIGAEQHTARRILLRTRRANEWAARVAEHPEQVLASHAEHVPFVQWAILHPKYGPVRPEHPVWATLVRRDERVARRRHYQRLRHVQRTQIRPTGMTLDTALRIAAAVLDEHDGAFPRPQLMSLFI